MTKLWDKGHEINKKIEHFTVGEDYKLDEKLVAYDAIASIAHATMLKKIEILKPAELEKLKKALVSLVNKHNQGKFSIKQEDEDVHTAIENYLVTKLGNLGKKIHTARSRNDQVLVDLHLYAKKELLEVKGLVLDLCKNLAEFAKKHEFVPMPGYTHMQKAMPSSIGLWIMSFTESLLDDLELIDAVYELNDQCPLGSGAGYGTSIPIDRTLVAKLLGFNKVQNNVLYVQNSRGKNEANIVFALSNIMNDLSKLATDILLFTMSELDYLKLPEDFCTGSSIMPQKKNLDVMELMRAKSSVVNANYFEIISITSNLPSGYNRDLQLTKKPLMESFEIVKEGLEIMALIIQNMKVNEHKLLESCSSEIFATDKVNELVMKGAPFRNAYIEVAKNIGNVKKVSAVDNIKSKKHTGATGNLGIKEIMLSIKNEEDALKKETFKFNSAVIKLVGGKIGF